jgi:hypothetical protein
LHLDVAGITSRVPGSEPEFPHLLDDAWDKTARLVTLLGAEPESAIVGCEPSCLFTLRDESIARCPTTRTAPAAPAGTQ